MSKVTDIYLNTILNEIMNGELCSSLLFLHGKFKTMELKTNDNTSVDQQTVSHYDTCTTAHFHKRFKFVAKYNKLNKPEIQCQLTVPTISY